MQTMRELASWVDILVAALKNRVNKSMQSVLVEVDVILWTFRFEVAVCVLESDKERGCLNVEFFTTARKLVRKFSKWLSTFSKSSSSIMYIRSRAMSKLLWLRLNRLQGDEAGQATCSASGAETRTPGDGSGVRSPSSGSGVSLHDVPLEMAFTDLTETPSCGSEEEPLSLVKKALRAVKKDVKLIQHVVGDHCWNGTLCHLEASLGVHMWKSQEDVNGLWFLAKGLGVANRVRNELEELGVSRDIMSDGQDSGLLQYLGSDSCMVLSLMRALVNFFEETVLGEESKDLVGWRLQALVLFPLENVVHGSVMGWSYEEKSGAESLFIFFSFFHSLSTVFILHCSSSTTVFWNVIRVTMSKFLFQTRMRSVFGRRRHAVHSVFPHSNFQS